MYSLVFYVPESDLETVKQAMFAAGAGRIGHYDSCCWQVRGTGQFRPLEGADPAVGKVGALENLDEWKVEMAVPAAVIGPVVAAMKKAHPYETVAYHVVRTEQL